MWWDEVVWLGWLGLDRAVRHILPEAYYLVWSFLACHLALIILLRDYGSEWALLLVCAAWA